MNAAVFPEPTTKAGSDSVKCMRIIITWEPLPQELH